MMWEGLYLLFMIGFCIYIGKIHADLDHKELLKAINESDNQS